MRKLICKATGCCRTIDADSGLKYCIEHRGLQRLEDEQRARKHFHTSYWTELYNSPKWKAMRKEKLRESPQCEECGAPATEVHHISPHEGNLELFYNTANLQALCHVCHLAHTQREILERQRRKRAESSKLWY